MIYLYQQTTEWFCHFARTLFSQNFAYFRENKTIGKISLVVGDYKSVNFIFAIILFSRIALKDIFATLNIRNKGMN